VSSSGFFSIDKEDYDTKYRTLKAPLCKTLLHLHRPLWRNVRGKEEYIDGKKFFLHPGQLILRQGVFASDLNVASNTIGRHLEILEREGLITVEKISHSIKIVTIPFYKYEKGNVRTLISPTKTAWETDGCEMVSERDCTENGMGSDGKGIRGTNLQDSYTDRANSNEKLKYKKARGCSTSGALSDRAPSTSFSKKKRKGRKVKKVTTHEEQMEDYRYREPTAIGDVLSSLPILQEDRSEAFKEES